MNPDIRVPSIVTWDTVADYIKQSADNNDERSWHGPRPATGTKTMAAKKDGKSDNNLCLALTWRGLFSQVQYTL